MRTEDGSIIQECINGEPGAFGVLVDKYKEGIYAFVYTKLQDFQDAQDVTQEVFLRAYRDLRSLRRWESFAFWLYRIAYARCAEWLKHKSKRADQDFIEDQSPEVINTLSLGFYHADQLNEFVWEALNSLPEIHREVLVLCYFGGMKSSEMAKALGISPAAIRKRLSRARAQLREEMITMMDTAFDGRRLPAGFTIRVVEMVKQMKIQPIPRPTGFPWGLSLAMGILVTVLSLNSHISIPGDMAIPSGSALPAETRALKTGEIPVEIMRTSEISVIPSMGGNGDGSMPQNASMLAAQAEGDTWTVKSEMPTARTGLSACTVNSKIYAVGGASANIPFSTVEEYDPSTDTWTEKADMPTGRYFLATCEVNGKIYAIGGNGGQGMDFMDLSTVEEYDPVKNQWTEKADMPTPRHWLSASSVNGRIYAIGGLCSGRGHLSTVEEYDPVGDKWTRKADLPRRLHTLSTSVANGKIYAFAGVDNAVLIPTVYEYDPIKDKWTSKSDMPTVRWRVTTSTVNGRIYVIGGVDDMFVPPDSKAIPTVEEYDPVADKWTKKTGMPVSRFDHACSAADGKIYVFGGYGSDFDWETSVLEYDTGFSGEEVSPEGKLPTTWGNMRTVMNKRYWQ